VFTRAERAPQPTDGHFAMLFTVKNEAGSLLRAVEAIGENGFNLRSLKSRPTKETNWEYYFYVEGEGSIASPAGEKMTAALQKVCGTLRILGSFGNIRLLHDPENVLHAEPSADALSEASLRAEDGEN
jgi:prephenate dehydratase